MVGIPGHNDTPQHPPKTDADEAGDHEVVAKTSGAELVEAQKDAAEERKEDGYR